MLYRMNRIAILARRRRAWLYRTSTFFVASLVVPLVARAQSQRQADIHGTYSRGATSHTNSWGAGTQLQLVWGKTPVQLGTSLGGDVMRPQSGGPTQWSAGVDVVLQPGGASTVTPYAGGSVSANWSTGTGSMWEGARHGLETLAGVQIKLGASSSSPMGKIEERFGYIEGQEHTLATRVGVVMSF